MENKKRPCLVTSRRYVAPPTFGCGHWEGMNFEGLFHQCGNEEVHQGEKGFGLTVIGIVEDETGQIHTVNPNHIKFIDR